ncbi:Ppx/GppA phosphatase family protein [uncultured Desulfobacterium sp.]|uniref:Ppx/GppA phosphatase family protein n=1 Tax=uncultured Desulfobacterium sp. TaxID=201089 RepID=A0A445N1I9_9BACT|nr:Ppx/GppA phosphatase family protein [uncultured Desulfobacterium sp.]
MKTITDSDKYKNFIMSKLRASIDLGSHTARLLIASDPIAGEAIRAIERRREYIYLAEYISKNVKNVLGPEALTHTLGVLNNFLGVIKTYKVDSIEAIGTGVIRQARNRDEFLGRIYEDTGISIRPVSGDEEAQLTAKGALNALSVESVPFMIFDLGGGSTEFFFGCDKTTTVKSLPLGAAVLTNGYLNSDPPDDPEIKSLTDYVCQTLNEGLPAGDDWKNLLVIGTGGTVTTLAMMIQGFSEQEVNPERINGLALTSRQIKDAFDTVRKINLDKRLKMPGLDEGRAGVIVAGALVVINILDFFKSVQLKVSMSDLLEGILLGYIDGGHNGKR